MTRTMEALNLEDEKDYTPLLHHSRKILDHMWCALEPEGYNSKQAGDFFSFKRNMRGRWSRPLLYTITMLAAMINCHIGLSAAPWIRKLFVPALIKYNDGTRILGLPAKHARPSKRWEFERMLSVGRHLIRQWAKTWCL